MITDKTIDPTSAKYWCIMADPKLQKQLQSIISTSSRSKVDESIGNILRYASYLFTASSLVSFLTPYFKNMWRKMTVGGSTMIAEVQFEADGYSYRAWFDIDKKMWQLHSSVSITDRETMQFFETKFFQQFNQRCAEYISPLLNSREAILKNIKNLQPENVQKLVKKILDSKNIIIQNMFGVKYLT